MSLMEVMVAVAILTTGLAAVFGSLLTARNFNRHSQNFALAYQEIQAQIETYQYLPFVGLQNDFKGAAFDVYGLRAPTGRSSVGTVTLTTNANINPSTLTGSDPYVTGYPYAAGSGNPNNPGGRSMIPLRFRCEWDEDGVTTAAEVIYVLSYRGI